MSDCGVYILFDGDVPVYVGSSVRMHGRVKDHNHKGKFTRVEYLHFPESSLEAEEAKLIAELRPALNKKSKTTRKTKDSVFRGRRCIPFRDEDEAVLDDLKVKLEPLHGPLRPTAIVRLAMREMNQRMRYLPDGTNRPERNVDTGEEYAQ